MTGPGRIAVVAGANGFVGRAVAGELAARGWEVRGLLRRAGAQLGDGVTPVVVEDPLRPGALDDALAGADAVVNAAGRAHVFRDSADDPLAEFRRVNVGLARALAEAAGRAGVAHLVEVSSVAAVSGASPGRLAAGCTPAPTTPYGVSKLEAERAATAACAAAGVRLSVVRPPLVYGPGMRGNPLRLFRLVASGAPLPLGAVATRRSVVYVGNLAAAIATLLERQREPFGTFFVADAETPATSDLVRRIAAALGVRARLVAVPLPLLHAVARAGDVAAALVPFPLTSEVLDRLAGALELDTSPLTDGAGFAPPVPLDEGLRRTAAWFHAARVV